MNILGIIFILIILLNMKISIKENNQNYLSRDNTSSIKGIFIIIVFISHALSYITSQNMELNICSYITSVLGQLMVTMFLFYSGYGIYEGIKGKTNYVKNLPRKRILSTLLHFDLIIVVYALINLLINQKVFDLSAYLLSLVGWESVGNSNWYIFVILVCYCCAYFSFSIFKKRGCSIICNWILCFAAMILLMQLKAGQHWWYDTILCFPLGITFSYFKDVFEKNVLKNNLRYIAVLISSIAVFLIMRVFDNNILIYELLAMTFCLIIVLLTVKVNIKNKILLYFGNNLFYVYILQRIPMIILTKFGINIYPVPFILISLLVTVILTYIFSAIIKRLDSILIKDK